MSETESATPARQAMPRHTTPTWEMELLISGATVFALMQLPGLIDAWVNHWMPRFDAEAAVMVLLPSVYLKSAVYALIVTFVLHLGTRGYWVALVGLASVYPQGLRWEGLKWGPNYLQVVRSRMPALPEQIERADNRASQVFGFGLGFALVLLVPLVFVTAIAVLAYGVYLFVDKRWPWTWIWNGLMMAAGAPYFAAVMIDRWFGSRLASEGSTARSIRATLGRYHRIGFSSFTNFPVALFMSQFGQRRGGMLFGVGVLLLVSFTMLQHLWAGVGSAIGQFGPAYIADSDTQRRLEPQHYADQRDATDTLNLLPFIGSEVARGDYVRLFIPYRPRRDAAAVDKHCLEFDIGAGEDHRLNEAMACLDRLYLVSLDGKPIDDPQFDRAVDAATGVNGVVAMIRIADLPVGRHELEVARPLEEGRAPNRPPRKPYRIAFWR